VLPGEASRALVLVLQPSNYHGGETGTAQFLPSLPAEALAKVGMAQVLSGAGAIAVQVLERALLLSPVTDFENGIGAASRYRFARSRKTIQVQRLNCEQLCESGYIDMQFLS